MILKFPALTMSNALIMAVILVEETNVVSLPEPLKLTTELVIKLLPSTLSKNSGSPSMTDVGEIEVMTGKQPEGGLIAKTLKLPALSMSEPRILAISFLLEI